MIARFFFSSRRRHTRCSRDWSSDVCSSDLFEYFLEMIRGLKQRCPGVHLKAFTMIEVGYFARIAKLSTRETLVKLKEAGDRKSTRLNSSHGYISYAVFCLKKKKLNSYRDNV